MTSPRCMFTWIYSDMIYQKMLIRCLHENRVTIQCVFAYSFSNLISEKMQTHRLQMKTTLVQFSVFPWIWSFRKYRSAEFKRKCFLSRVCFHLAFQMGSMENADLQTSKENGFSLPCVCISFFSERICPNI